MKDRSVRILEILSANKSFKINILAEILDVSEVTLRRDLDNLEKKGMVCRKHGYACLDGADNTGKRMAFFYSIKRRIARAAGQLIEDGETIMLESGSCCTLFAEELAVSGKNITIITNSAFIANYIYKQPKIKIILLGGFFLPESQVMVGPMTAKCAQMFFVDKFFLGADGFVKEQGFTGRDHLRVETALELVKRVNKVFILTESAKFKRHGTYDLIQFNKVTGVFTDDGIQKEDEDILIKNKISLYKVPSAEEKIAWRHYPGQTPFLYKDKKPQ